MRIPLTPPLPPLRSAAVPEGGGAEALPGLAKGEQRGSLADSLASLTGDAAEGAETDTGGEAEGGSAEPEEGLALSEEEGGETEEEEPGESPELPPSAEPSDDSQMTNSDVAAVLAKLAHVGFGKPAPSALPSQRLLVNGVNEEVAAESSGRAALVLPPLAHPALPSTPPCSTWFQLHNTTNSTLTLELSVAPAPLPHAHFSLDEPQDTEPSAEPSSSFNTHMSADTSFSVATAAAAASAASTAFPAATTNPDGAHAASSAAANVGDGGGDGGGGGAGAVAAAAKLAAAANAAGRGSPRTPGGGPSVFGADGCAEFEAGGVHLEVRTLPKMRGRANLSPRLSLSIYIYIYIYMDRYI